MMTVKSDYQPPFKWTGGKNRMFASYENIFFPENVDTFVDMFGGACSVSMWMRTRFPDATIVLNDYNSELMAMYGTFQTAFEPMLSEYKQVVDTFLSTEQDDRKSFYYDLREQYCFDENMEDYKKHALLYFMLQVNFNGMWKAYKKCGGKYSTPPGTLKQKPKFFDLNKTYKFKEFLDTCVLTNKDFGDLAEHANGTTFFYADPPYRDSVVDYQGGFGDSEQLRLSSFLKQRAEEGHLIAESNKEVGDGFWLKAFGGEYNIHEVPAKYTAGRGTSVLDVREVLITNF